MTNYIIHRRDRENAGDMASNPKHYFKGWLDEFKVIDIVDVEWANLDGSHVILGGGGLLYDDFTPFMHMIIKSNLKSLTLWGIGRNRHHINDNSFPSFADALFEKADLIGLRDCQLHPDWVPCVSVMHPLFRNDAFWRRAGDGEGVLACQHREDRFRFDYPPADDWHEMKMQGRPTLIIEEIIKSDVVVSSSYHGALWGLCAGKRVCAVDGFSQKFRTGLPDSVRLLSSLELNQGRKLRTAILNSIQPTPEWIQEAQMRTIAFASKVQKLLSA